MGAAYAEGTFLLPPPLLRNKDIKIDLSALQCRDRAGAFTSFSSVALCGEVPWLWLNSSQGLALVFLGDQLLSQPFQQNCANVWEPSGSTWQQTRSPLKQGPLLGDVVVWMEPRKVVGHWSWILRFLSCLYSQQFTQICPQIGNVSLLYKWDCQLNLNEYIRHARIERDSI